MDTDIERLRNDIAQLYDMDRENRDRHADINARLKTLEDDKADKQFNVGTILGVLGAVIAAGAVIISLVVR